MPSPYVEFDRAAWSRLRENHPLNLDDADLARLRGLGDRVDLNEVEEVYLPLSRLLNFYVGATRAAAPGDERLPRRAPGQDAVRHRRRRLGRRRQVDDRPHPARDARPLARHAARRARHDRRLPLPQRRARARGACCSARASPSPTTAGRCCASSPRSSRASAEVTAPVYSHLTYDIVPGERIVVRQPDVLIVEGLNVLQAPEVHPVRGTGLAVSDFFDFSVYVDAWVDDVRKWYVERFLRLRETAFSDPDSYFHRYAVLSDDEAVATANRIWREINGPNLVENILPTRSRATPRAVQGREPRGPPGAPAQDLTVCGWARSGARPPWVPAGSCSTWYVSTSAASAPATSTRRCTGCRRTSRCTRGPT